MGDLRERSHHLPAMQGQSLSRQEAAWVSGQHSTHTFKRLTQPAENWLLSGGQEQHRAHSNSVKENFLYHFQSSSSHCQLF